MFLLKKGYHIERNGCVNMKTVMTALIVGNIGV